MQNKSVSWFKIRKPNFSTQHKHRSLKLSTCTAIKFNQLLKLLKFYNTLCQSRNSTTFYRTRQLITTFTRTPHQSYPETDGSNMHPTALFKKIRFIIINLPMLGLPSGFSLQNSVGIFHLPVHSAYVSHLILLYLMVVTV